MMNVIGLQTIIRREIERFLRTYLQSLVSPWISAFLYIVVFGVVVGQRIPPISGITYIDFVLPGILMLNLITASFSQTSFSLYFQRFAKHIEEILVAPLSHVEMILGMVTGGVLRGLATGIGVYVLALFFTSASFAHFGLFLIYALGVSIIFSLVGLLIALWAENFEQLSILTTFVIMPLTFLGGVFNSVSMLPEKVQIFVHLNPFFYFVDGLRYAMIGVHEGSIAVGLTMMGGLIVVLGVTVWTLFERGWKLRN